jgi:adenylate cyclase
MHSVMQGGGVVDKAVGDEVVALFGALGEFDGNSPDAAPLAAVRTAFDALSSHESLLAKWVKMNVKNGAGVGIATGPVLVGEVGSSLRTDFTAMGASVNLAARLCGCAPAGKIYISGPTREALGGTVNVKPVTGLSMKGIPKDMRVFEVVSIAQTQ